MIERILERTLLLFLSSGFSKTNTDDISSHIGISKRTLYRYFETKEKLIDAVFSYMREKVKAKFDTVLSETTKEPFDRFKTLLFFVSDLGSKMSKSFAQDVEKARPDIYEMMKNFRRERIKSMTGLLKEAQIKKQIRSDIDPELAVDILLATVDGILNPTYLANSKHSNLSAFEAIISIFLEGLEEKSKISHYALREQAE
ncbi:AcrR family transcriptional regulator [Leptospira perolatii]|uniref:AcrR family transcriptional regulator n=1 Tax=Leptospira perolatii TaxID=2023191 RepID=A0A2M9ZLV1_9LEPT|nr:TetR/AcrR family transcriptional regulator [Leptospira perolatii]PJZ69717.1 AcrR family transcriptional regulator [Leptospira perolatii]PJZ73068.1 AcrR family transcriptional regulator [Leptospira perolatii]